MSLRELARYACSIGLRMACDDSEEPPLVPGASKASLHDADVGRATEAGRMAAARKRERQRVRNVLRRDSEQRRQQRAAAASLRAKGLGVHERRDFF